MASTSNLMPKTRKGVLLTLGITFLALVVLALATFILQNAESSEERLVEFAGMDRLYNLGSSTELSLADAFFPFTGIKYNITNETIGMSRQMYPFPDTTLFSVDPTWLDYKFLVRTVLSEYMSSVSKGVHKLLETDPTTNRLALIFKPTEISYWLTTEMFNATDDYPYPPILINHDETTPNSTIIFVVTGVTGVSEIDKIYRYDFYFKHDTRNGVINWSKGESGEVTGRKKTVGNGNPVEINITVDGPNGYSVSEFADDVYVNGTNKGFPQVIFIENLTAVPLPLDRRPSIRFFDGSYQSEDNNAGFNFNFTGTVNAFSIFNFNEQLFSDFTLHTNTTYNELYTTLQVTSHLPEFGMFRQHLVRFA